MMWRWSPPKPLTRVLSFVYLVTLSHCCSDVREHAGCDAPGEVLDHVYYMLLYLRGFTAMHGGGGRLEAS